MPPLCQTISLPLGVVLTYQPSATWRPDALTAHRVWIWAASAGLKEDVVPPTFAARKVSRSLAVDRIRRRQPARCCRTNRELSLLMANAVGFGNLGSAISPPGFRQE